MIILGLYCFQNLFMTVVLFIADNIYTSGVTAKKYSRLKVLTGTYFQGTKALLSTSDLVITFILGNKYFPGLKVLPFRERYAN